MLDLYLSELRRFRNAAAIYGVACLLVLTLLSQLIELATAPRELHQVFFLLTMISGLGFAAFQFVTYRQPSRWIWLQHRPLHRARILAAIMLASATLIALAYALPVFTVLIAQDHFTDRVVDARHYGGAAFLALSALSAWLAGAYMVLHRSRWAFVILVLPLLLTMHMAAWTTVLALSVLCNVILALLVYTVFRPNRSSAGDAVATIASALPLQASFYLALLWGGSTLFQVGQMLAGVHPLSSDHVARGGYIETTRADDREIMLAGLAGARDPRAAAWRAGLTEQNTANAGPDVRQYAVQNVISTEGDLTLMDRGIRWTFSHDRMLYKGMHMRTRQPQGWFGAGGQGSTTAFDSQPVPVRDNQRHGYLVTAHDLYAVSGARPVHVLHVDGAEQLAGGVAVLGERTALLTNRRLIILGPAQKSGPVSIALPLPIGHLGRAQVAQVPEGMLVSFVYGRRRLDGVMSAPQITWLVGADGHIAEVARREIAHDFPVLFEHKDWWLSPALQALVALPSLLVDHGVIPDAGVSRFEPLLRERPAAAWLAALLAALAAAGGALWWTRAGHASTRARAAWTAACLLAGPPALLALMVLQPRDQAARHAAAVPPAAAPAA